VPVFCTSVWLGTACTGRHAWLVSSPWPARASSFHVLRGLLAAQVKSGGMATAKDPEMSPFEASRRLLSFDADGLSLA
jgi:hypothetical protein